MTRDRSLDPDDVVAWLATLWPSSGHSEIVAGVDEDDCAVLSLKEQILVITTDFLNASPIALQLGIGGLYDLGRLVVDVNLADLCGSGAKPIALLTAITMEHGSQLTDYKQLMSGIHDEATRWDIPVVGGDTKLGACQAILAIAVGTAESRDQLFLKNQARAGDQLWVSGEIGACCSALVGLSDGLMDEDWNAWARKSILTPILPLHKSRLLAEAAWAHGGTDISDGLGADLADMCSASDVGARLFAENLPVSAEVLKLASSMDLPAYRFALGIGGDLQFVVTVPSSFSDEMESWGFTCIGEITEEPGVFLVLPDSPGVPLAATGHRDARRLSFVEEVKHILSHMEDGSGVIP